MRSIIQSEHCAICGCRLHRSGQYGKWTKQGRSHATRHHFVAERFFGRSVNRRGTQTKSVFAKCPWSKEGQTEVFCYECHELLLHNPVLLPEDVKRFSALVRKRRLGESEKPNDCSRIARRIKLLHDVIERGLSSLEKET